MKIHAFHGQRFADKNGDPGSWAAPPFDQISRDLGERLRTDPYHFTHLTRPDPEANDPHGASCSTLERWIEEGHVIQDSEPSLYLYETTLPDGGRRLGLCALAEVGRGDIRPHEQTVDKTVEERLELLRRTQTDLEPVFLLTDDGGKLNQLLESEPTARATRALDLDGNRHAIQAIADPGRIASYRDALGEIDGLIADGHHRTRVATLYAREVRAEGSQAPGCKMVVIVSLASPGLTIDPIHRAWKGEADIGRLSGMAEIQTLDVADGREVAAAVAEAEAPTIGVWRHGGQAELWRLDADAIRATSDVAVPDLPVSLFHAAFPALGWDPGCATDGTITYRSDPARLGQEMRDGDFALSVWLPPMSPNAFGRALEVAPVLPPKSTRFLPKLVSGLVWSPHRQQIL